MDNHDALREEIQRDRLAMMDTINSGFDRLADMFMEHAKEDAREFSDVKQRLTDVERTQKVIGGGLVAVITGFIGSAFAWLLGR